MKISYDWRGMPIEFKLQDEENSSDSTRLAMMYDGSGRRISKTLLTKPATAATWDTVKVTHYTGIGTEIREEFHNGSRERVSVVVNMPQGLGRYKVADASQPAEDNASRTFEWYLKNHLGSTMLVYGTVVSTDPNTADIGETKAAYDYRAFGEMVTLSQPSDKVTENFTGKEHDEEIKLNYFGARYLDPMLGMWISVDNARQFDSPYLYMGNGYNPITGVDGDGNVVDMTYNQKNGYTTVSDRDESRNHRKGGISFDSYSGHHDDPNETGGPIPKGKYFIVPDPNHKNYFRLYADDGKIDDVIDKGKEGVGRKNFRFHRYATGTDGCISVKDISKPLYEELVDWIKGTETYTVKDANGKDLTVYGELEVYNEDP